MNDSYVVEWLCPLLSLAFFLSFSQSAAMRILAGVDAHGKIAIRSFVVSLIVYSISLAIALAIGFNVISAAIIVGMGMSVGPGLVVMAGACKRFDTGVLEYLRRSMLPPLLCNFSLVAITVGSRIIYPDLSLLGAILWGGGGGIVVLLSYWQFLLTVETRAALATQIMGIIRR